MSKTTRTTVLIIILASLATVGTDAQDFSIDRYTISGGGTLGTGGSFVLSATIGQPDASTAILTGGDFELVAGFWGGTSRFCFGDLDNDNDIDLADLAELLGHYGETSGMTYEDGDLDGDGDVDLADLADLLGVYGTTCD